jgi:peptidoglycan/LPS O-acetylase OafA/YrhL
MLDALTGLRFVAAFCVFLHHARERLSIDSWNLGPLGGFAVGFFFVLSGFILMHVYGNQLKSSGILRFLVARFARVWPLHIACLFLSLLLFRWSNPPTGADELVRVFSQITLTQTWGTNVEEILGFNGVAWSISVEAFFYALFPFLCILDDTKFARTYAAIALGTFCVLALGEWSLGLQPTGLATIKNVLHFTPPMRLLEFATGIATARVAARWAAHSNAGLAPVRDTGIELAAFGLVTLSYCLLGPANWIRHLIAPDTARVVQMYLPSGPGFALPFAFLILWLARSHGFLAWALSRRVVIFLGEVSFAFYMVHSMILMLTAQSGLASDGKWGLAFALALAASLAAATLLHYAIERPARDLLLAAWDGRWKGKLRQTLLAPVAGWRNVPVMASIATLLLCPWIAHLSIADERALYAAERLRAAPPHLRDIVFADEAIVVAVDARIEGSKFKLEVVYEPLPTAARKLFCHVTDAQGQIQRHLTFRDAEFIAPPTPGSPARVLQIASSELPLQQLSSAHSIGIGFWSATRNASRANRGPLSMGGHRLEVFTVPQR